MEELGFDRVGVDAVVELGEVAVETGLAFNCGEFAGVKIGVINGFPDAEKLDGVPISEPVRDEKIPILGLEHVSQGYEVTVWRIQNRDFCSLDFDARLRSFFHGREISTHV